MLLVKRLTLLVAVLATLTAALVPPALAQTPQGDNVAVAQNTKDNSTVFDLSFNIRRVMATGVDIDNAAAAVSSCESCRTIAVAIQVVLIFSDPESVTTDNLALALNVECELCETMALAYQYVLTTGGPVHFTPEGNKAINDILKRLAEIEDNADSMTLEEIAAAVDGLVEELYAVVDTELVAAGKPAATEEGQAASDTASPDAGTTGTPTPDGTPAASPTATDAPEASPTVEGSDSPTASPVPEESPATTP